MEKIPGLDKFVVDYDVLNSIVSLNHLEPCNWAYEFDEERLPLLLDKALGHRDACEYSKGNPGAPTSRDSNSTA